MKLSKILIVLLAVLSLSFSTGKYEKSNREKNKTIVEKSKTITVSRKELTILVKEYKLSIQKLVFMRKLLLEEAARWKKLHSNPVPDVYKIKRTDTGYILKLEIDTKIKNIINSTPIARTIELEMEKETRPFLFNVIDMFLVGTATYPGGMRPAIGVGIRIPILTAIIPKYTGLGLYSSIFTSGAMIYYSSPRMKRLSVHILAGVHLDGRVSGGVGLGVRF